MIGFFFRSVLIYLIFPSQELGRLYHQEIKGKMNLVPEKEFQLEQTCWYQLDRKKGQTR